MGRTSLPKTIAAKHLLNDVVKKGNHIVRTSTGYLAAALDSTPTVQGRYAGICDDYTDNHLKTQTGDGSNKLTISPAGLQTKVPITGATQAKVGNPVYVTGAYGAQVLTMTKSGVEVGILNEFRSATDCDLLYFTTYGEYASLFYAGVIDEGVAADVYTITTIPSVDEYANGQTFIVLAPNADNTGAATLNVCGLGAKAIVDGEGSALRAGAIVTSMALLVVYDGTSFVLLNPAIEVTRKPNEADVLTVADVGVAADAYVAVTDPVIALAAGLTLILTAPNADNTGASVLTYNTVADAIIDGEGNALRAGAIVATMPAVVIFNGADWVLQNDAIEVTRKDEAADVLTVVDTGVAANAYVAVTDPAIALVAGLTLILTAPNADNDAASDITYNGVADNIFDGEGNELQPGDIVTTMPAVMVFDGVNWVLVNPATQVTRKDNQPIMLMDIDTGVAADAYVAVTDPAPVLADGIVLILVAPNADCGAGGVQLTFNGVADAVLIAGGGNPAATDIQTDCPAMMYFDGTNWILLNPQS